MAAAFSPLALSTELEGFVAEAAELEELFDGLDAQTFEQSLPGLIPPINDLSSRTCAALDRVRVAYEERGGEAESLVGLVFYAVHELRKRRDRLARLAGQSLDLALIAEFGGILRSLQRALDAVLVLVCKIEKIPAKKAPIRHLNLALDIRSAYTKFRREIAEVAARHRAESRSATATLQSAATSIAKLIGRDIFVRLRLTDRIELRNLQTRILEWRTSGADPLAAERLWQDLCGYAQLLHKVNQRQELVEHDREVLSGLLDWAAQADSGDERYRAILRTRAAALLGRDDLLDAVLLGDPSAEELLKTLEGLRSSLLFVGPEIASVGDALGAPEEGPGVMGLILPGGVRL